MTQLNTDDRNRLRSIALETAEKIASEANRDGASVLNEAYWRELAEKLETPITPSINYRGHVIVVNTDFQFKVTGPEFPNSKAAYFSNVSAAKEAIDKAVEEAAKEDLRGVNLGLKIITTSGETGLIEKIDRRTGLLVGPNISDMSDTVVYPSSAEWITNAVVRVKELKELQRKLKAVEIKINRHSFGSGNMSASKAAQEIESTKKEYQQKSELAQNVADEPVLKAVS